MLNLFTLIILAVAIILCLVKGDFQFDGEEYRLRVAAIPLTLVFLGLLIASTATSVDSGTVGVPKAFGKFGEPIGEGLHFVAPWVDVESFDITQQAYTMSAKAAEGQVKGNDAVAITTSDNLTINVDATVLTRVQPDSAEDILRKLGSGYIAKVVRPNSREVIRSAGTSFTALGIVTTDRQAYTAKVRADLEKALKPYNIEVVSVNIRDMPLPGTLRKAIEAKAKAIQDADAKQSKLVEAQLDGDITRTKAQATADSQQIVACGGVSQEITDDNGKKKTIVIPNRGAACDQTQLTPQFLQSEYIKALKDLVDAPNNSTLILPTDSNLTPLLNMGK